MIPPRPNSCSQRSNACTSVSGTSCISPFIDRPPCRDVVSWLSSPFGHHERVRGPVCPRGCVHPVDVPEDRPLYHKSTRRAASLVAVIAVVVGAVVAGAVSAAATPSAAHPSLEQLVQQAAAVKVRLNLA